MIGKKEYALKTNLSDGDNRQYEWVVRVEERKRVVSLYVLWEKK